MKTHFKLLKGTFPNGNQDDSIQRYFIEEGEEVYSFNINESTLVVDNTGKLKNEWHKGDVFSAYVNLNKPMLAIYPPQYNPELVIVETNQMGFYKVDVFNEDFVNGNNDLKLNLYDELEIVDLDGNIVAVEEIINEPIAVFYTRTTFSLPPQTPPNKIILLREKHE